jgi:hypothetical protein
MIIIMRYECERGTVSGGISRSGKEGGKDTKGKEHGSTIYKYIYMHNAPHQMLFENGGQEERGMRM